MSAGMSRAHRPATSASLRERLRTQLADLKMPGALEALDDILRRCDSGQVSPGDAIEQLLGAHIQLRNARRLQTAMRSARLPVVKTDVNARNTASRPGYETGGSHTLWRGHSS